ncbi:MAG: hypothetical protein JWO31_479, partial [Phycisphaerales bacterium]|nr:hypothetical protein [Phycisphaerales bacterium]
YLLKCQSALSGFAKLLNPSLDAYRVAASKLFVPFPYFPDAYVPALTSADPASGALLKRLMHGDWRASRFAVRQFGGTFRTRAPAEVKIHWWRRLKASVRRPLGRMKRRVLRRRDPVSGQ